MEKRAKQAKQAKEAKRNKQTVARLKCKAEDCEFLTHEPEALEMPWYWIPRHTWPLLQSSLCALARETVWYCQYLFSQCFWKVQPGWDFYIKIRRPGYEGMFLEHLYQWWEDMYSRPLNSA